MWPFKGRKKLYNKIGEVRIVDIQFGMQVSYRRVGSDKIHNNFYESFSSVEKAVMRDLVKVVFQGGVRQ